MEEESVFVVLVSGSFFLLLFFFLEGSHPDSASGGPGERWREARAKHETDRKQIGPEPTAINHHGGARPSHSSHMHTDNAQTHIQAHTNMHSRK